MQFKTISLLFNPTILSVIINCLLTPPKPSVEIINLLNNELVSGSVNITVDADSVNGIDNVTFYIDGVLIAVNKTSPYESHWDSTSVSDGIYNLTVVASILGARNNNSILLQVNNIGLHIIITSHGNGDVVSGVMNFTVFSEDIPVGIDNVSFYMDGELIQDGYSIPFSCLWNSTNVLDGVHELTVVARNPIGDEVSTSILIYVKNIPTGPLTLLDVIPWILIIGSTVGVIVGVTIQVLKSINRENNSKLKLGSDVSSISSK